MSQWLPIHPTIVDPSTGGPLRALAIVGDIPVWPAFGSQDENEDGSETEETDDSKLEEKDSEEETESETGTISQEKYDQLLRRMQAADRAKSQAEDKVKEFEKAGQSELEKLQTEAAEEKKRADELAEQLQSERIANSFLASNSVTWHNVTDALNMLRTDYMDGVEIGEDGRISGMKEAIKKMAKEKSYLVNSGGGGSSTDDVMNGRRKGDKGDTRTRDTDLAKRMPALRGRVSD